jgi:CDI immunity proteins
MLIGQKEGLDALVPLALERLEADPLAEGDYYPGDLLAAVLAIPSAHWLAHTRQRDRLSAVLDTVTDPSGALRKEAGFNIDAAAATFRTTLAHKPEDAG